MTPMNSADIQKLTALMERYGIAAFDYEQGSVQLRLTLGSSVEAAAITEPARSSGIRESDTLRSPAVGIVLHSHPASASPAPALPRQAARGEIVAYIKTGMTLRAIATAKDCVLRRALTAEGKGVGYGDALFEIAPD
ncbi:hypothetical protein [Rhizobium herbae]|uniref:Biotin carboxyl carrier protein n=1 Tax=Rhizobium herbae TaxID=508661 RepID=A0ABS4EJL7_9HYPH|nr:hypothetical protein [Rhizobium herbae]MBP1858133.1 biotin carboxyl carrier protein [Rhizobium herbae]